MAELEFLAPAIKDLERIAEYHLRMVGPESALKISDGVLDTIQILSRRNIT